MGSMDRAWQLFSESYAVLSKDVEILLFPLMSGISVVLLAVSFFVPLYRTGVFETLRLGRGGWQEYAALFACLRVPSSSPSVSLRLRDLHDPVSALPWAQGVAQQFLNFLPLPQGQ